MPKKVKIAVSGITLTLMICGLVRWFLPVHFLHGVKSEEIKSILVSNGNNGDVFEVADPDDISWLADSIKNITLRKDGFVPGADYYYRLTFLGENGEEVDSFGIQNYHYMRRGDFFYRCDGELDTVAGYLENLEAIRFPDYKKDPDFPYPDSDSD